jgi:excisionase family DNA binding protein
VAGLANLLVMRGEEAAARIKARQLAQSPDAETVSPAGGSSGQHGALLSVDEAAERSGLGAGRIRDLLRSGRLAGHKAGPKVWLVDPVSLNAWMRVHAAEVA